MARPSATAAILFLLLSLLAVAHCRPLEAAADPATDAESAAVVEASDDNGPPNPTLPAEAGAVEVVLPADQQQQHGFLRLPSHGFGLRRHRPCHHGLFHRHHWWARHRGGFGDAPRRFHFHHRHPEVASHLPVLPSGEIGEDGESRAVHVAEPDPDRSIPDSDGKGEVVARREQPSSFSDADGAHEAGHHEDEVAAVRAWKREMRRRWFHFHHHGHHGKEEEDSEGTKRFHHHRRHHDEDEEKDMMLRKRFRHAEHDDGSDSDDEEVEELVRRFRKAIMRRRFGSHGRRFHHHYGHRHAEEADAHEESGVVSWIKGLMNRF